MIVCLERCCRLVGWIDVPPSVVPFSRTAAKNAIPASQCVSLPHLYTVVPGHDPVVVSRNTHPAFAKTLLCPLPCPLPPPPSSPFHLLSSLTLHYRL